MGTFREIGLMGNGKNGTKKRKGGGTEICGPKKFPEKKRSTISGAGQPAGPSLFVIRTFALSFRTHIGKTFTIIGLCHGTIHFNLPSKPLWLESQNFSNTGAPPFPGRPLLVPPRGGRGREPIKKGGGVFFHFARGHGGWIFRASNRPPGQGPEESTWKKQGSGVCWAFFF